jgi:hypothetical protein
VFTTNQKTFGIVVLAICIVSGLGYLSVNARTNTFQVYVQLLPSNIEPGDSLTISTNVTDYLSRPVDEATVTATIGDLEIIYFLTQLGKGYYEVTIDTPIMTTGTYNITVTVQKEGFALTRISTNLIITEVD